MRLLHLCDTAEWRGREMQALALCSGIAAKRHDVVLGARRGSPLAGHAEGAGIEVVTWPARGPGRWLAARRLIASGSHDVVHLHDTGALKLMARSVPGGTRAACVLSVRGDVSYGGRLLGRGLPLRRVGHFWAVSEWVWSALVRGGIAEERISVIHTGVDLPRFRAEARRERGLSRDAFVAGCAVHLTGEKGVEDLIEAGRMIRTGECPPGEADLRLLILGDGPRRAALERTARRSGMSEAVLLAGWRPDPERLFPAMDVYVHPATGGGGFPVAMREAMAMGIPVVATDLMGIREIIDNGKHGLVAPAGQPDALARNIMRMRRDATFARDCGRAGHLKVQRYGTRAMVDRAEELYFRLVR